MKCNDGRGQVKGRLGYVQLRSCGDLSDRKDRQSPVLSFVPAAQKASCLVTVKVLRESTVKTVPEQWAPHSRSCV